MEDTGYAVDLIQLQKRKGGEIYHILLSTSAKKTGKAKSAGKLGSWDVPSLTSSQSLSRN